MPDALDLYELCVQSPRHVVETLRAVHGAAPVALREDFCGTAAVSRRWCADAAKARERAREAGLADRVTAEVGDCLAKGGPHADEPADVAFVGNFSVGYLHRRSTLMGYMKRSLARLRTGPLGPGVLACDTYGGAGAFQLGETRRRHVGPRGEVVHYLWRHERADPVTGMVTNSISLDVERDGEIVERLPRAFVYEWRLWSIAELREAMLEVGFRAVDVYREVATAPGRAPTPVGSPGELGTDWVVLVVGRA